LDAGHTLAWGVIPAATEDFDREHLETILERIEGMWDYLVTKGVDKNRILQQGLLAPAKCCLMNPDKSVTVERTFDLLRQVSAKLREKYGLA
jgi:hypothetical protein